MNIGENIGESAYKWTNLILIKLKGLLPRLWADERRGKCCGKTKNTNPKLMCVVPFLNEFLAIQLNRQENNFRNVHLIYHLILCR